MKSSASKSWSAARSVCSACLVLACASAQADIISGKLSFTASGLPVDPIVGTVEFSFDNSAGFFNAANGATVNGAPVAVSVSGLSLAGGWTPVLTYVKNGVIGGVAVADLMSIGHSLNGTQTLTGTDDWRIAFNTVSTGPSFREFTYTLAGSTGVQFQSFNGSVTAVPEPAGIWLLGLGLATLGLTRRGTVRR